MLYIHWKWPCQALNPRRGIAPGPPVVGAALHWLHSLRLPLLFTIIFHHSDWAGYNPGSRTTPLWWQFRTTEIKIKNKAQLMTTRTMIPRTTPHQDHDPKDNSPPGPLPTSKSTHQDQFLYGGQLSWWGVVFSHFVHVFPFQAPVQFLIFRKILCVI